MVLWSWELPYPTDHSALHAGCEEDTSGPRRAHLPVQPDFSNTPREAGRQVPEVRMYVQSSCATCRIVQCLMHALI
jgi:hypothetical protein